MLKRSIFAIPLLLLLCGCPPKNPLSDNATGDAITRAQVRNTTLQQQVTEANKHAPDSIKPNLNTASTELHAQSGDLTEAKSDLQKERDNANGLFTDLQKLHANPFVKVALFIQHFIVITIVAWVVLGIAGVVLQAFTGGTGVLIGTEILHLLPLANPFRWIINLIGNLKQGTA